MSAVKEETINLLYDAAIEQIVSIKTEANSWEKVCKFIHEMWDETPAVVAAAFEAVEQRVKETMGIKSMSGAWRSSKATAIKMHGERFAPITPAGLVVPKTHAHNTMMAAKKATVDVGAVLMSDAIRKAKSLKRTLDSMSDTNRKTFLHHNIEMIGFFKEMQDDS